MNHQTIRTGMRVIGPDGTFSGTVAALTQSAILLRSPGADATLRRVALAAIDSVGTEVRLRDPDAACADMTPSEPVKPRHAGLFLRLAIVILIAIVLAILAYALFYFPHGPHG